MRFARLSSSLGGSTTFAICERGLGFKFGSSDSPPAIRGYRVYFKRIKEELIILLAGGDKSSQAKDIKTAQRLARNLTE